MGPTSGNRCPGEIFPELDGLLMMIMICDKSEVVRIELLSSRRPRHL